ncbi:MAG TPA: hypothetical protein VKR31_03980 [Rhizomicrobium sp.]|nr:hypothetical protein [Rhizomicrobium sp.]
MTYGRLVTRGAPTPFERRPWVTGLTVMVVIFALAFAALFVGCQ